MKVKVILIAAVLMGTGILHSQDLPPSARHALDKRFANWTFRPNHIPNPCDQYGTDRTSFPAVQECNLNEDNIPDFGVGITTGKDSHLIEYFLAIVSNGANYEIFLIDSAKALQGAGHRLLVVVHAGDSTASFGGDEVELLKYGHLNADGEMLIFPTDALRVLPGCESWYKEIESNEYVYVKGRLLWFCTGE